MSANVARAEGSRTETCWWKQTYGNIVWSEDGPKLTHRGVLHTLLTSTDKLGRVWRGLPSLARQLGISERNARRFLRDLEMQGWIKRHPMTWENLSIQQAKLGFPLPARADGGQAPHVIVLCYKGDKACELPVAPRRKLTLVRAAEGGQNVQGGPRTMPTEQAPDKLSADQGSSLFLSDTDQKGGEERSTLAMVQDDSTEKGATLATAPADSAKPTLTIVADGSDMAQKEPLAAMVQTDSSQAAPKPAPAMVQDDSMACWVILLAAYHRHYQRVYHGRPTHEPDMKLAVPLGGHVADIVKLFRARLLDRKASISEAEARELLADEVMKAWLDHPGANNYLRKISHKLFALADDLPYYCRKAVERLLEKHSPPPEPRRAASVVPISLAKHLFRQPNQNAGNHEKDPSEKLAPTPRVSGMVSSTGRNSPKAPELSLAGQKLATALGERAIGIEIAVLNEFAAIAQESGGDVGFGRVAGAIAEVESRPKMGMISEQERRILLFRAVCAVSSG